VGKGGISSILAGRSPHTASELTHTYESAAGERAFAVKPGAHACPARLAWAAARSSPAASNNMAAARIETALIDPTGFIAIPSCVDMATRREEFQLRRSAALNP
jgi:hypothetical protein